jgi:hypothetical protein
MRGACRLHVTRIQVQELDEDLRTDLASIKEAVLGGNVASLVYSGKTYRHVLH